MDRNLLSPSYFLSPEHPRSLRSDELSLNSKVSPNVLLIIVILAVIFFVSALLHLLVRFLLRPPFRDPEDSGNVTALQGQLQQLFHLHDAGVDQSFIDTLPVFHYKAIIGSKTPFDCAVCLCEFEGEDKLRLLPKCSHAFHMECIDTWLLSHSTCPLCRACLLPDFSPTTTCSPFVFVLESGGESSTEMVLESGDAILRIGSHLGRTSSHLGLQCGSDFGSTRIECSHRGTEIAGIDESAPAEALAVAFEGEKVVPVKLGKFRNADVVGEVGEVSGGKNVDERRCFSMGSFEYVMDDNSVLQVPIRTPVNKQSSKKASAAHRAAMSECDCESKREFNGFESAKIVASTSGKSENKNKNKRESLSISKIWLRGKQRKLTPTRASSFHFPAQRSAIAARTVSDMQIGRWENGGSELGGDEENQSCNSLDSQANQPSFARKTLLWLVGRQNKVVHSSFSPQV